MNQTNTSKVPSFIYAGAQRSGSTWLFKNLYKHRQIYLPPVKELHYFDLLDSELAPDSYNINRNNRLFRFRRFIGSIRSGFMGQRDLAEDMIFWWNYIQMDGTISWYKSLFESSARAGKVTGDITPAYSTLTEQSIRRLRSLSPNLKIIFILRNPIDRSFSQLARNLVAKEGSESSNVSIQEMLDILSSEDCMSRSDYLTTLERYKKYFSDEEIFVGFFEEIKICPHDLLMRICRFIGVEPLSETEVVKGSPNARSSLIGKMEPEILRFLVDTYEPMIAQMSIQLGGYAEQWRQDLLEYQSILAKQAIH